MADEHDDITEEGELDDEQDDELDDDFDLSGVAPAGAF
jgi:GTP-binding protein Era